MAEGKKSIIVYSDWIELFEVLSDEEAGKLIKHFFRYVNDLNPEPVDRLTEISFIPIKQSLKRDLKKWDEIRQKRSESGRLGGRPKKQIKAKKANALLEKQTEAKKAVSVNVSVNDNVNEYKDIPVFEEFKKYALSKKSNIDISHLKTKYDAWIENGWKDGNNKKIVNWKSKLLNTIPYLKELNGLSSKPPKVDISKRQV